MKKRKLNSKNPKYKPKTKEQVDTREWRLDCTVKGVKVYSVYTK